MGAANKIEPDEKGQKNRLDDIKEYLRANIDVKESGICPQLHWEKYGIKENRPITFKKELSTFESEGYVVINEAINVNIINSALKKIEEFKNKNREMWERNSDPNGFIRRMTNLHRYDEAIQKIFSQNTAARLCDYIFEESTCIYTSLFFEAGSEQPIHRDTPYFHTKPINKFLGFWVALEDVTLKNGPLQLVPRGHKSKEQDLEKIGKKHYTNLDKINPNSMELWSEYQKAMDNQCTNEGLYKIQVEMKKGDTLIWHPMLPHGGSVISNPKLTRKSIVFHVTPFNTPVYQQDAFFNPKKELKDTPDWSYLTIDGRKVAQIGNSVQFPGFHNGKRDEVEIG